MEVGTSTVKLLPAPAESPSIEKCIICQTATSDPTISNANGWKRICEAADIRKDAVSQRLKLLGNHEENIVYHMTNDCYKKYTLRKTLETLDEAMPHGLRWDKEDTFHHLCASLEGAVEQVLWAQATTVQPTSSASFRRGLEHSSKQSVSKQSCMLGGGLKASYSSNSSRTFAG